MAYTFSRTLTSDGSLVPATQTNFMAAFSITDNDLRTTGNGGNIENTDGGRPADFDIFSDAGLTTGLNFKIISYNPATGAILGWVKVPSLAGTTDTTLYIGYGDAAVTTYQGNDTGIYDTTIISHYELGDGSSLNTNDSSGNGHNGTGANGASATTGKIHGGVALASASNQYVTLTNTMQTSTFTWSAWVNAASLPNAYNAALSRNQSPGTFFTALYVKSNGKLYVDVKPTTGPAGAGYDGTGSHTISTGTWYRLSIVGDSVASPTTCNGYVNGALDGGGTSVFDLDTTSITTRIGSDAAVDPGRQWDGLVDEVILVNVARSANWLLTEYRNQNDPAAFWTLGMQEGGFTSNLREELGFSDRLSFSLINAFSQAPREVAAMSDRLTYALVETFSVTLRERIGMTDRVGAASFDAITATMRETIGMTDRISGAYQNPTPAGVGSLVLTHLYFDEGTENYSSHEVTGPHHDHTGTVILFGGTEREVEIPHGPPRLSDMIVEFSDTDQYWRKKFGAKTPRMRKADFLIGPAGGSEALFQRPAKVTITHATFPPGKMRLEGSDLRNKFLTKPLPMVINSTNYANLPPGVTEAFFPFVLGIVEAELGALKAIHVDTVQHRYTAAFHPIESVEVFTKTPEETEFQLTPYGYSLVQEELVLDGRANHPNYIQFDSALPEGTEVQYNCHGVNFRGEWGTFPQINEVNRNVVDHTINMLYYIKRLDEPVPDFSDYDVNSFAVVREKIEALGIVSDYAITTPLTGQEILTQLHGPPLVHMIPDNLDRIKLVKITDSDFEDAPIINDFDGTLLKSEIISLASPTFNQYRYRIAPNFVSGQFGQEATYDNVADQEVLGEVEALQVDMYSIRDADVAAELMAERSAWEDHESHRIRISLDTPSTITDIDLLKPFRFSHYGGLADGGWEQEFFVPYRVRYDLDRLVTEVDAIRRPIIANPEEQIGAIGDWLLNARGGPEYLDSERRLFLWFADTRASFQKLVVLGSDSDGAMIPLDDGIYPTLTHQIASYDGLFDDADLHMATQEFTSGRVGYTKFDGSVPEYEILNATVLASNSHGDVGVTIAIQQPSGKATIMLQGDREFSSGFPPFPAAGPAGMYKRAYVTVRNDDGTWTTPEMMGNPADAFANIWFPVWGDPNYNSAVHVNTGRAIAGEGNRVHFFFTRNEPGDVASTPDFLVQTLRSDGTLSQTVEWDMTVGGEISAEFLIGDGCSFEDEDGQLWIAVPIGELANPKIALWKDVDNLGTPDNIVHLSAFPVEVQPDTFGRKMPPISVRYFEGRLHVVHGTRQSGQNEWAAYKTISPPFETATAAPAYTSGPRDRQIGPVWSPTIYARHGFDIKRLRDGRVYIFKATAGNFGVTEAEALWILEKIDVAEDIPADPGFTVQDFVDQFD